MTADDVLEFLNANQDKKFASKQIAYRVKCTTQTMTMTLAALGSQVQSEVNGKTRHWWIESEEVRKQKQAKQIEYQAKIERNKRPLKIDRGMIEAMKRCKELYPNGGNFKSIC
jgi:hypothetical protein